jgi:hypothetical protein
LPNRKRYQEVGLSSIGTKIGSGSVWKRRQAKRAIAVGKKQILRFAQDDNSL